MWVQTRLQYLKEASAPVLLAGSDDLGIPRLLSALADETELIWVEFAASDDSISTGGKLSDAVRQAFGYRLFPKGLPYTAALSLLAAHAHLLGPYTFAVSNVHCNVAFAKDLLFLTGHRFILSSDTPKVAASLGEVTILDERELRLSEAEALSLVPALKQDDILEILQRTSHAYEPFLAEVSIRLGQEPPPFNSPRGLRFSPGGEQAILPEALLEALIKKGDWMRAADVAVRHVPGRAGEVLLRAAPMFHEQGLHSHLWQLLEYLPRPLQLRSDILFWRLSAATRLNRSEQIKEEVRLHLSEHEAPELRALFAGVYLPVVEGRKVVESAYQTAATPFTVYQHGRFLESHAEGAAILYEAVRLAERVGYPYDVARNASMLAARLIELGEFQKAAHWGEWALTYFDEHDLGDAQRRLVIVNNLAYVRILVGETVGLETLLLDNEVHVARAFPGYRDLFRSTLGDYLVATERPAEALKYYRANWEGASRLFLGVSALSMVRGLLNLNSPERGEALGVAERAFALTERSGWSYHAPSILALGATYSFTEPQRSLPLLDKILSAEPARLSARYKIQATLFRAHALSSLGKRSEARRCVDEVKSGDLALSGLKLFSAKSEAFQEIQSWYSGDEALLELRFLGRREITLQGQQLKVTPQQRDILALIISHPEGIPSEGLHLKLLGEAPKHNALHAALSKLRRFLPISYDPYRLQISAKADFLDILTYLNGGRLRQALELYKGPLLPESDAPGIVELREVLEEALRQAALNSTDSEVLLALARMFESDMELWEAAIAALPQRDPRTPIVKAQYMRIQATS